MREKVRQLIATTLNKKIEEVKEESNLVNDLKVDEINLVEIAMEIEELYNTLLITEVEIETFVTVKDIIDYVVNNVPSGTV
jgi:acyl carrier protein